MAPSSSTDDSPRKLSPFVFWAQTESRITLRVQLSALSVPKVTATFDAIEFFAHGIGANTGKNDYYFKFIFFKEVDCNVHVSKKPMQVEITLNKKELEWWPRLTKETNKPAWLKLDFDRLKTDEDEDSEASDYTSYKPSETLSNIRNRQKRYRKRVEDFRKIYLFLYNLSQLIGFLYVLIVLSLRYAKEGEDFVENAYPAVQFAFTFCQLFQILEIIHPLLGYTTGSVIGPLIQVCGRFIMIFMMINAEPRIQSKPIVFYLLYTYSLSEVIRYPYYMLRAYNADVGLITWLRYTAWIILYPLGFLCEGIIILRNIPYFEETKRFSVFLPNKWNISIYFPTIMRIFLLIGLFPTLYFMMTYMYRQRVRALGVNRKTKED